MARRRPHRGRWRLTSDGAVGAKGFGNGAFKSPLDAAQGRTARVGDLKSQPVPRVDAGDVERVLLRDFPPATLLEARRMLEVLPGSVGPRIQLAILKLAQGELGSLSTAIAVAERDWRDVVAAAEYPAYGRLPISAGPEARDAACEADWRQYEQWLGDGSSASTPP